MPNLVSFKVFLDKSNNSSERVEVRRFGIEQDVATNYSYLVEKLKTIFPCLMEANAKLNLYWKDSDNDKIAISSDAELIIALTEMDEPIKKIYIETTSTSCHENMEASEDFLPGFSHEEGDGLRNLHRGITCDGCDGSVIGFRYKCVQCPDFDLCSTCEGKGLHPEHLMLRMPNSASGILGVKVCDCGGKKRGKCCCDVNGRGSRDMPEYPFMCPFSKKHSKKHWKNHVSKLSGASFIADTVTQTLIDSFTNASARVSGRRTRCRAQQASQTCDSTTQESSDNKNCESAAQSSTSANCDVPHASASASVNMASGSAQTGNGNNGNTPNNNYNDFIGDLISNVGPIVMESLRQQNNPLIDFLNEIMPENNNRSNANETPSAKKESSNESSKVQIPTDEKPESNKTTAASTEDVKEGNPHNVEEINGKSSAVFTIISDNNDSSGSRQIKIAASDINKLIHDLEQLGVKNGQTVVGSASTVAPSAPTEKDSKEMNQARSNDNDGIRVKAVGVEQKDEENGWTLLNESSSLNEPGHDSKTTNASENINSTGAIPKTSSPRENTNQQPSSRNADNGQQYPDFVANGLHRMLAMGFSNEGNWLADLLKKNNGDVAAVIDLLLPLKQNAFDKN